MFCSTCPDCLTRCLWSWLWRCPHVLVVLRVGPICGSGSVSLFWTSFLQLETEPWDSPPPPPHHTFLDTRAMGATLSITAARPSINMVARINQLIKWDRQRLAVPKASASAATAAAADGSCTTRRPCAPCEGLHSAVLHSAALVLDVGSLLAFVAVEDHSSSMFLVPCPECVVPLQ